MHINNEYVKNGPIEAEELFVQTEVTEDHVNQLANNPRLVRRQDVD
jgi:hypothetical protein